MILQILGVGALCALSYESPYHNWITNGLRKNKPTGGIKLFLLNLMVCPQCYFYWLSLILLSISPFTILTFTNAAIADIIGVFILKNIRKL